VQVDPFKPTLKASGNERLKLKYDKLLSSCAFNFDLHRYRKGEAPEPRAGVRSGRVPGEAVQVDPIKPTLKAPGNKRMKLKCDKLLSTSAFKFNLRRYSPGAPACRSSTF